MPDHVSNRPRRARLRVLSVGVAALVAAALLPGQAAAAAPSQACEKRNNNTYDKLLECVRIANDPVALSLEVAKAGPDPEVALEA